MKASTSTQRPRTSGSKRALLPKAARRQRIATKHALLKAANASKPVPKPKVKADAGSFETKPQATKAPMPPLVVESHQNPVTKFGKDFVHGFVDDAIDTGKGLGSAASGAWKMTAGAVVHPEVAARLWHQAGEIARAIAKHPGLVGKAIVGPYVKMWKTGHPGAVFGHLAFQIASAITIGAISHQVSAGLSHASHALDLFVNSIDDVARATAQISIVAADVTQEIKK